MRITTILLLLAFSVVACTEGTPGPKLQVVLQIDESRGAMADRDVALDGVLEVIQNRLDNLGVRRSRVERVGSDRILVELPLRQDDNHPPVADNPVIELLTKRALLELKIATDGRDFLGALPELDSLIAAESPGGKADPLSALLVESGDSGELLVEPTEVATVTTYLALPPVRDRIPQTISLAWEEGDRIVEGELYRALWVLEADPLITGEHIVDAGAEQDASFDIWVVNFELTREGGDILERATASHIGDLLAIVFDGEVQGHPPVIRGAVGRRGQIEIGRGPDDLRRAQDMALLLRAMPLPAPVIVLEVGVAEPEP